MAETMVYLNGRVLPKGEARIDPDDRGFLFGDGIYEVLPVVEGLPLFVEEHFARMERSAAGIELSQPLSLGAFRDMACALIAQNGIGTGLVYLQVTRGTAPRNHAFPAPGTAPTVYAFAKEVPDNPALQLEGVAVVVAEDERWARVDLKTVNLLPNAIAAERAARAGAHEAILVRDGVVTEGSHSNAWIVQAGVALTHPTGRRILPGVTRDAVLRAAGEDGIAAAERAFSREELDGADEVFLTGTTTGVLPVVRVDGRVVGDGRPGPTTRRLAESYGRVLKAQVARAKGAVPA